MKDFAYEPRLEELMSDAATNLVMHADGVDVPSASKLYAQVAQSLESTHPAASPAPRPGRIKRMLLAGAGVIALVAVATFGYDYWTSGRFLESTDDAYVKADFTVIAPKVSGYIAEVLVNDNQSVAAGTVLARIDDRDLRTAFDQANADVETAQATIHGLDAQLALQQSAIAEAGATIKSTEAGVDFARQDRNRYQELLKTGYGTVQRAQQSDATFRQQSSALERDRALRLAAQQQVEVLNVERARAQKSLAHYQAAAQQAAQNLSYATITAPIDGTVGARSLRVGQYVQAGTQLMAVVPLQSAYVVANFKETQLARMYNGEPVTVSVDGVGGVNIQGHVDSLSPASGLEFSLLPPDNATGNFTKIVQRIPVKIALDAGSPGVERLRAGMSVEATVDTKVRAPKASAEKAVAAN